MLAEIMTENAINRVTKVERLNLIPTEWHKARKKIIDRYKGNEKGLNIENIKTFMVEMGLFPTTCVFINNKEFNDIKNYLNSIHPPLGYLFVQTDTVGLYIRELDICLIIRDQSKEVENGVAYTEGTAIHEMTHAAHAFKSIYRIQKKVNFSFLGDYEIMDTEVYSMPRCGFAVNNEQKFTQFGFFLEEAFCEYMRVKYLLNYRQHDIEEKWGQYFGRTDIDVLRGYVNLTLNIPQYNNPQVLFPIVYASIDGEHINLSESSIAGQTLNMLIHKEPQLLNLLIDARSNTQSYLIMIKVLKNLLGGNYVKFMSGRNNLKNNYEKYEWISTMFQTKDQ